MFGLGAFGDLAELQDMGVFARSGIQPIIDGFPGVSWQEKLPVAFQQARAVLSKYTSTLAYDANAAAELFNQIETWQSTHSATIQMYMKDPATQTVPEQIALAFDPIKAQQLIVAGFVEAARGLGPWASGFVGQNYGSYPGLTQDVAQKDGLSRISAFAGLIKMDQDGTLTKIFNPPATSGFGIEPVTVILILLVTAIAGITVYFTVTKVNQQNNKLMLDICKYAADNGMSGTVDSCAKYAAESSQGTVEKAVQTVAKYVGIGALLYIGVVYVLPALTGNRSDAHA